MLRAMNPLFLFISVSTSQHKSRLHPSLLVQCLSGHMIDNDSAHFIEVRMIVERICLRSFERLAQTSSLKLLKHKPIRHLNPEGAPHRRTALTKAVGAPRDRAGHRGQVAGRSAPHTAQSLRATRAIRMARALIRGDGATARGNHGARGSHRARRNHRAHGRCGRRGPCRQKHGRRSEGMVFTC
jgi:hypothetical protein